MATLTQASHTGVERTDTRQNNALGLQKRIAVFCEFDLRADQIRSRGRQEHPFARRSNRLAQRYPPDQRLVDRLARALEFGQSRIGDYPRRRVALRIEIDQQHLPIADSRSGLLRLLRLATRSGCASTGIGCVFIGNGRASSGIGSASMRIACGSTGVGFMAPLS